MNVTKQRKWAVPIAIVYVKTIIDYTKSYWIQQLRSSECVVQG